MPQYRDQFFEHINKMLALTSDQTVLDYWTDIPRLKAQGFDFLPFQLEGSLQWEPENASIRVGDTEVASGHVELVGKPISHIQLPYYRQLQLGLHTINLKIHRDIPTSEPAEAKKLILTTIEDVSFKTGFLAWVYRTALEWYPARYLPVEYRTIPNPTSSSIPNQEPVVSFTFFQQGKYEKGITSSLITTTAMKQCLERIEQVHGHADGKVLVPRHRALTWYRLGCLQKSLVNKFLNLFQAVESLCSYSSSTENSTGSRIDREKEAVRIVQDCSLANINESITLIRQANDVLNSKIRYQFELLRNHLSAADESETEFNEFLKTRNKIAHGGLREGEPEKVEELKISCHRINDFAWRFIGLFLRKHFQIDIWSLMNGDDTDGK